MAWSRMRIQAELAGYIRQVGTRRRPGHLNDRSYDRDPDKIVKRMKPEDIQRALGDERDEEPESN